MFELIKDKDIWFILREEKLKGSDIIKKGDEYNDQQETKISIKNHLKKLAKKFRNLDFVEDTFVNPSPANRGLSNYITVIFKHPDNISKQEIEDNYLYLIRYSDHKDKHPEKDVDYHINLVGRRVDKLGYGGMKFLFSKLPEIQDDISEFENKKFGKELTNILDDKTNNSAKTECIKLRIRESVSLDERLEEIENGTYCTDYVGDIVNWLLNKPKPYRMLKDSYFDIWCIADANKTTHRDMSIDIFDSDYLYSVSKNLDYEINKMREHGNYSNGWTDAEVYSDYGFDNRNLMGLFFIPNGDNYFNYEESGFYPKRTKITTGTIFTRYSFPETFPDLFKKLKIMNAIEYS